jgi:hypothetical protein
VSLNVRLETCLRHQTSGDNFQSEIDGVGADAIASKLAPTEAVRQRIRNQR